MMQSLTGVNVIPRNCPIMSPEQARQSPPTHAVTSSRSVSCCPDPGARGAFDGANLASVIAAILERDAPSVTGIGTPATL